MKYNKQDFVMVGGSLLFLFAAIALVLSGIRFGPLTGHSMEPTFYPGDIFVCTPEPSYGKNDVALFVNEEVGTRVAHRIVYSQNGFYKTSGDNNDHIDKYNKFKTDKDILCSMEAVIHTSGEGEGFISLDP